MIKFYLSTLFLTLFCMFFAQARAQTIVANSKSDFLNQIIELRGVSSLKLEGNIEFIDFAELRKLVNLRVLDMESLSGNSVEQSALKGCERLEEVIFPSSLKSLDSYCLANCKNLKRVYFGDHLEVIGSNSFQNCGNLTSMSLPATIKSIGNFTFLRCVALRSLIINSDTPPAIGTSTFDTKHKIVISVNQKALTIYNKERIWKDLFNKKSSIKSIW